MDVTRSDDALRFDRRQFWHQETLLYNPAVADFMDNFFDHYHLSGTGCGVLGVDGGLGFAEISTSEPVAAILRQAVGRTVRVSASASRQTARGGAKSRLNRF